MGEWCYCELNGIAAGVRRGVREIASKTTAVRADVSINDELDGTFNKSKRRRGASIFSWPVLVWAAPLQWSDH
jgi:hypothetical protein